MMSKILVIDTENNGALRNNAHPFDYNNRMCLFGGYDGYNFSIIDVQYSDSSDMCMDAIEKIRGEINACSTLIGFNLKYDLHWLRRYGITVPPNVTVWDCQLAQFLIEKQQSVYPSLDETARYHSIPLSKLRTLTNYFARNIDVDGIPKEKLTTYLKGDLKLTYEVFLKQKPLITGLLYPLFNLQCQDLLVLEDMEWNGIQYDLKGNNERMSLCLEEEEKIKSMLKLLVPEGKVNWNSTHDVSTVLYGGKQSWAERIPDGVFLSGKRKGQTRYRIRAMTIDRPRLVDPLPNSALMSAGHWSVAEDKLKQLRATGKAKAIIKLLLELSKYEKLRTTYLEGIPKVINNLNWDGGIIHGSINQCVARTGRTSSNKPNLQNIPLEGKEFFVSRYTP